MEGRYQRYPKRKKKKKKKLKKNTLLFKENKSHSTLTHSARVFPPTSVSLGSLVHLEIYVELLRKVLERANRASRTAIRITNNRRARNNSV